MNIQFVEEPDSDLIKRKSLYLDPESDLSLTISKVQDAIESEGFTVDRSRYRYIRGRLCKFHIELVDEPDVSVLNRRANSMKKINLNLAKLKWEFQSRTYTLKIGKVQGKDIYIIVAFLAEELNEIERERIKDVKDRIVKGESLPVISEMKINITPPSIDNLETKLENSFGASFENQSFENSSSPKGELCQRQAFKRIESSLLDSSKLTVINSKDECKTIEALNSPKGPLLQPQKTINKSIQPPAVIKSDPIPIINKPNNINKSFFRIRG